MGGGVSVISKIQFGFTFILKYNTYNMIKLYISDRPPKCQHISKSQHEQVAPREGQQQQAASTLGEGQQQQVAPREGQQQHVASASGEIKEQKAGSAQQCQTDLAFTEQLKLKEYEYAAVITTENILLHTAQENIVTIRQDTL